MARTPPTWLSRIEPMLPGEVIIIPDAKSTEAIRTHLRSEELATGRQYSCRKNKLGTGISVRRDA